MQRPNNYYNQISYTDEKINMPHISSKDNKTRKIKLAKNEYKRLVKNIDKELVYRKAIVTCLYMPAGMGLAGAGIGAYAGIARGDATAIAVSGILFVLSVGQAGITHLADSFSGNKETIKSLKEIKKRYKKNHKEKIEDVKMEYRTQKVKSKTKK